MSTEKGTQTDADERTTVSPGSSSNLKQGEKYTPEQNVRIVTAASLFDGHDATINIIRRILQSSGAEVIHLGHNRSVTDIVECAIQEDAQGIAVSSYQGGHMEYFTYMVDLLKEKNASHIKVFGGGGGVIVDDEIRKLHEAGVDRIFSPEDGRTMGLQGMINEILEKCDYPTTNAGSIDPQRLAEQDQQAIARLITAVENEQWEYLNRGESELFEIGEEGIKSRRNGQPQPIIGITGTGGAGKSSLTDELVRRFLNEFEDLQIGVLSIDPSKVKSGGALLGDRIRMNSITVTDRVYMRSMATRASNRAISPSVKGAIEVLKQAGFDLILVETSGIGQSGAEIVDLVDLSMYVMTSDYGSPTQLEKINMLEVADLVGLNKFDKQGSLDALRDVRKQYKRNHELWDQSVEQMPVYPTIAAQVNDEGVNRLFSALLVRLRDTFELNFESERYANSTPLEDTEGQLVISDQRQQYLTEIADTIREYHKWAEQQAEYADKFEEVDGTLEQLENWQEGEPEQMGEVLGQMRTRWWNKLDERPKNILEEWDEMFESYRQEQMSIRIRDRSIDFDLYKESLSGLDIPRIALPKTGRKGEQLRFALKENLPGYFPFTAGVYPFKKDAEQPTRMFAGEGTPERTNKRFHYLSRGMPAARLSTAFDSVTLYGEDPAYRPDIYGKVGNSGVSICTIDDMKKLYSGFRLTDPSTSVSKTINGPAPMILAMFMNTAVDQEVERYLKEKGEWEGAIREARNQYEKLPSYHGSLPEGNDGFGLGTLGISGDQLVDRETYEKIRRETLQVIRGTVQADILKEDQAQNTCIFSTGFALRMMGDIQEYFTQNKVRNYYSVSISGYHIAEAGANPITQAAFTLANGFTYVEYYLSRGLEVDDFAHNLSFFFSNGLDPEYAVIGRVARRIWAVAMRNLYGANERSQKLKYHIQTSGRSLHAQEIQFNDIRTTLQALMAIYDNCNSLHTNAYDEAITTPTEESVRRALAIQLIINEELGTAKNENINQGSYFLEELTDLVEEAILHEFDRLNRRGGVLGAMENMYQRGKIQDESLYYEEKKHSGEMPIIGVNTFNRNNEENGGEDRDVNLIRSTEEEKERQIQQLKAFQQRHETEADRALKKLTEAAQQGENLFEELMDTVKVASLGQITRTLYEVGGQYRRNM